MPTEYMVEAASAAIGDRQWHVLTPKGTKLVIEDRRVFNGPSGLAQATEFATSLRAAHPDWEVEIVKLVSCPPWGGYDARESSIASDALEARRRAASGAAGHGTGCSCRACE